MIYKTKKERLKKDLSIRDSYPRLIFQTRIYNYYIKYFCYFKYITNYKGEKNGTI